jgi:hypothetical protein
MPLRCTTPMDSGSTAKNSRDGSLCPSTFKNFMLKHEFRKIGLKKLLFNARKIGRSEERSESVMVVIEDITGKTGQTENVPEDR